MNDLAPHPARGAGAELTPSNVPDTGSTLLMLGLALGGLWCGMHVPRES